MGALLDRLVRGCLQQANEFQSWPYDAIVQIASPDDAQRSALEALRASTTAAAERLSAECPRDEPAPAGERLVAAEQAVDTVTSSFATVEPPLRAFFLSEPQRVAFYDLVSSSLKAADTLAGACPPENALTPLGRLTQMRARLLTVREATTAIRPAFTQFYDALDQGQKVRFAAMR